ncbi:YbaY family lipoprotein, partial [Promineifilum sp.]|uniref:YbaY family lipoprotein n=1 Tax=Promineifilum sp. TaxID=2664178 RepID=UPI0035B1193A
MKTQRTHSIAALLVLLTAALLLAACGAAEQQAAVGTVAQSTQPTIISGVVTYLDRSALPPNAVITVDVQRLGADGAPEAVIATQTINSEGQQQPFAFEVPFDGTQIDATRTYVVTARIDVDGVTTYASQTGIPVITGGAPLSGLEVMVFPATGGATGGELTGTLTGTVAYLERIALDPAAVIEVELQDATGG